MKTSNIKHVPAWAAVAALGLLSACSTVDVSSGPGFSAADGLAVLPIANYTETPEAGQRARAIAQSILYQKGFTGLQQYPQDETTDLLMASGADRMQQQALEWARNAGARYALTGSVQEWRYKVGLDGEPVVGLTLNLIDVSSATVVWSASGSRSGWSRSSLAGVGQTLIKEMLDPLSVK
ncbi:penicillin-binding protein activator LpoB [Pusillimonas sp. SM2304]|uniref:penicillin-binding protein activator LpoB n=1 Tax=Pusillimonas sp. SM2304 TaxID=3073241 RepID=UPI00287412BE|nr:penicillin-binding protein activator LpoB [Pusillimonas sp. SM2304]MDS1141650.1 penicillin-binding protein activator LpoB [Pusillimonas sp. SM2304]